MKKLISGVGVTSVYLFSAATAFAQDVEIPTPVNVQDVGIGNVIAAVVGFLLVIAAILAFIFLIIGGLQWITSGGDKAGMEAARNRITAAIVGLIIVAAAWAVMLLVGQFIGFNFLEGTFKIPTIVNPTG